ncbi:secreted protein [Melampsora americana]|nr:secreted protein [Melampsora americana]
MYSNIFLSLIVICAHQFFTGVSSATTPHKQQLPVVNLSPLKVELLDGHVRCYKPGKHHHQMSINDCVGLIMPSGERIEEFKPLPKWTVEWGHGDCALTFANSAKATSIPRFTTDDVVTLMDIISRVCPLDDQKRQYGGQYTMTSIAGKKIFPIQISLQNSRDPQCYRDDKTTECDAVNNGL